MEKSNKEKMSAGEELFGWAQSLIWALIFLVFISSFLVRISGVSGTSMFPTLHHGDKVFVKLFDYTPKKGDIVVVLAPHYDSEPLVKRIIALEGDTIEIIEGGTLYVNGEEMYEPYILEQSFSPNNLDGEYTVPEGFVFVMGDNRNNSADSRSSSIGPLETENIIGRVFFRAWPLGSFGGL